MSRAAVAAAVAAIAAVAALIAGGGRALAYPPAGYTGTVTVGCTRANPSEACNAWFTLTSPKGAPAPGVAVHFSVAGCGAVTPTSGVTDSSGEVLVTFIARSACCGPATVTATAQSVDVTVSTLVTVVCAGVKSVTAPTTGAGGGSNPAVTIETVAGHAAPPAGFIAGTLLIASGAVLVVLANRRRRRHGAA